MARIKKDDVFCCADCGLEVVVNKACSCYNPELICCGGPMRRGAAGEPQKPAAKKASVKAQPKSKSGKASRT
ncbi:MAG: hypothetical protein EG826_00270 [Deltaproteobacteria bacterium]|nr:hypothetical protein [Deltaproteobacteria bacterium]